jgi:hypothetical protein
MKFASIRAAGEELYGAVTGRWLYCSVSKLPTMGEFNRR